MAQNAYLSQIDPEWAAVEPFFPLAFHLDESSLQTFRDAVAKLMDENADKGRKLRP